MKNFLIIIGILGIIITALKFSISTQSCNHSHESELHELSNELDEIESTLLDIEVVMDGRISNLDNSELLKEFQIIKNELNGVNEKYSQIADCKGKKNDEILEKVKLRIDHAVDRLLDVVLDKFETHCRD